MPFVSDGPFTIYQINDKLWGLDRKIIYYDSKHTEKYIVIEKDFVSDGSSIPSLAWAVIGHPLQGAHGPVGFLHDLLYRRKLFPKKICDLIYLEAHEGLGTPPWKRKTAYYVLKFFGWYAWHFGKTPKI